MNAICDNCKEEYEVSVKTENLHDGIQKNYFSCPHCETEYIAFCTDASVRKKQSQIKILYYKLRQSRNSKAAKIIDEIDALESAIKAEMAVLKETLAAAKK